ncbi:protein phosphatase 2C domain-containing protein [Exiguobacterium sp. SH1S21]|uniref:protein phosphatase 2C domain-containing protein n=1 Tax=Exiguobacterium sp. SH1S21 TaxID=2510953 RepID=UPI00103B754B|nr:protein phosphatase 2C domain-containing protein [Exiguobacterium sp. SH1S21]TCI53048.1 protein phosphatase 2C domain-containing protein [Exiguobacterium sp. SH1S21]
MRSIPNQFHWTGAQSHYVDQIDVMSINHVHVGRFGGNSTKGQYKNEDGCLVWANEEQDWELAMILDAHQSADSAEALIDLLNANENSLIHLLNQSITRTYFSKIENHILQLLQSPEFLIKCEILKGETACLLVVRKDKYIWWLSVGDCVCFLFHDELVNLNQYQLNQRQFYEWIGKVNTFSQQIPCYSSGVRELRSGRSRILLVTDGVLECPGDPFIDSSELHRAFSGNTTQSLYSILETIQNKGVRDSTTLITWECAHKQPVMIPSDQK